MWRVSDHVTDVEDCIRCGNDHPQIHFSELEVPATLTDGHLYSHQGTCPATGKTVYLRFEDIDDE